MTPQISKPVGRRRRRSLYFSLVIATTVFDLALLTGAYRPGGFSPLELLLLVLYTILIAWIAASFWTAVMGYFTLFTGKDRLRLGNDNAAPKSISGGDEAFRTAIVMPIYNEDPVRVFAGLKAIFHCLQETGKGDHFDVFILSDTRDPDIWVQEELQWRQWCVEANLGGRVFYRNRVENTARKSGNLADFVANWGGRYRYMIVLDADSLMSGTTLVEMVRRMEANPRVALLQVPPVPVNRESLFSRMLQFASSLYGRMFTAGLSYWQLADSNYWGHNAIIRVRAFAAHCGLPHLPGREPLGGEILSHDFVEAALLRRAGWEVWLAYDLNGSYEEIPPTLIDYAKRDRRWCQGNLQHARLATARNLRPLSRLHLVMGVMSYLASPLWFIFLVVTGLEAYVQTIQEPIYFFGDNLFPVWPESYRVEMTTVLVVTLAMLFLPKILAWALLFRDSDLARQYGGVSRAGLSVIIESLFSVLFAPILMLFQTKFVTAILLRKNVGWPPQQRGDHQTGLVEAFSAHAGQSLLAIGAGLLSYYQVPAFFWWFTPVLAGAVIAVPLSMITSRTSLGRGTRRLGLFKTPAEHRPPRVLELMKKELKHLAQSPAASANWYLAAFDPAIYTFHASLLPDVQPSRKRRHYVEGLMIQLEDEGPKGLSGSEKRALLSHRDTLRELHNMLWALHAMEFTESEGSPSGAETS